MRYYIKHSLPIAITAALALAGCGKGSEEKAATQVAAKVNGTEISVHQINSALQRTGGAPPEQAKKAAPQVLERIIDQQLLVQKAVEAKLDRDPQVMQSIENSRKQILAQAYVEKTMSAAGKGGADEIRNFYDQNPALFQERRLYRFQEISFVAPKEKVAELRTEAAKAKSLNEVATWLKAQNIQFNVASAAKAAEQLPLELLPELSKLKDGQIVLIGGGSGGTVIQLAQSQKAPLTQQQATPIIEQYLSNRKRLELAEAEVKRLRAAAKIEYVGEFVTTKPGQSVEAKPEAAAPASAPASLVAPASGKGDPAIDKGLAGLR
jgi:EpsD family peptidyl-prolyl cis-trans isomerase